MGVENRLKKTTISVTHSQHYQEKNLEHEREREGEKEGKREREGESCTAHLKLYPRSASLARPPRKETAVADLFSLSFSPSSAAEIQSFPFFLFSQRNKLVK